MKRIALCCNRLLRSFEVLYKHEIARRGVQPVIDERTLVKREVMRNRISILHHVASKSERGGLVAIDTSSVGKLVGLSRASVWRHLIWLDANGWIIWPEDKRRIREPEKHYSWRAEVQVNWDCVIGGLTVQEWIRVFRPAKTPLVKRPQMPKLKK